MEEHFPETDYKPTFREKFTDFYQTGREFIYENYAIILLLLSLVLVFIGFPILYILLTPSDAPISPREVRVILYFMFVLCSLGVFGILRIFNAYLGNTKMLFHSANNIKHLSKGLDTTNKMLLHQQQESDVLRGLVNQSKSIDKHLSDVSKGLNSLDTNVEKLNIAITDATQQSKSQNGK